MPEKDNQRDQFDFASHEQTAVSAYLRVRPFYEDLSSVVARVIEECLGKRKISVHSVQSRSKDPVSFGRKSAIPSEENPELPKYDNPLEQITDLAGVRVITNVLQTIEDVDKLITDEFKIIEKSDKTKDLMNSEKFGYQSVHYLVSLNGSRAELAEYEKYSAGIVEIQVRTILQHAWAEMEHDIQYKSSYSIPSEIRRRFMSLAGMLEVADREFEAIQDADKKLSAVAQAQVAKGRLAGVEITPRSLKAFLDKSFGPDGRLSDWSYEFASNNLKRMGFVDLKQVEAAIEPYNDDDVSRIIEGTRIGQVGRFEHVILAALGEKFIEHHPWNRESWFQSSRKRYLKVLRENGIETGKFDPRSNF